MIIFLYGEDTFRSRRQLKKMIEKFKTERDPQGLNVVVLDCNQENPSLILEQIMATPFLAEKRMVVLENLLSVTKKSDLQEQILGYLEAKKLPEENIYIFWEGDVKPKTNISKDLLSRLTQEKYAQPFEVYKGAKLSAWVNQEIKEKGGNISRYALEYLIENTNGDTWKTNSLIDQLTAYVQDREIELKDVQLFLDEKIDDNIFNLVDALIAGQTKKVYQMIQEQYRIGEDAQFILSMILRQIKILLELRDLYDREDTMSSEILAKQLGLHPFVVKKSLPFVKKYNQDKLKNIYTKLLDIDIKTKTGQGDQSILLDILVGKMIE